MELKCLLMWLLLGSVKGNKPDSGLHILVQPAALREECPALPRTKFADVTAETYAVGTRLYYECDSGYTRRRGQYPGIRCQSMQQGASWVYKEFECIYERILLSVAPTMELDITQKPETKTQSSAHQERGNLSEFDQKDERILLSVAPTMELDITQKPETKTQSSAHQERGNLSEFDQKDFCGPPKTIPHAYLGLNKQYYVGQVLHFKCQSGYDKRSPTSGTRTCKKVNGKIIWTPLDLQCTNDSSYRDRRPDVPVSQWCPVHIVSGSTPPSSSSSVTLPVTAVFLVLLIIPTVFL